MRGGAQEALREGGGAGRASSGDIRFYTEEGDAAQPGESTEEIKTALDLVLHPSQSVSAAPASLLHAQKSVSSLREVATEIQRGRLQGGRAEE